MPLISAQELGVQVQSNILLQDVSFQLRAGEILGLVGPNGAGKSTLLKILAHLLPGYTGRYYLNGLDITHYSPKQRARQIGYLAQGGSVHWPLCVRKVIELGRLPHLGFFSKLQDSDIQAVEHAIKRTELDELLERPVTTLSGGEKMRVLIARLLAGEPSVILADEPTAMLDPYHQLHVLELLRDHARQGGAVVVVLHDLNHAAHFCDRLLVLHQGRLLADASLSELVQNRVLQDVYRVDLDVFDKNKRTFISPYQRYQTEATL